MRLSFASLAGLLSLASSATITLHITTTQSIPNPNALPPSTHATLSTFGQPVLSAPLSTSNTFVFRNVTSGSYLADIHCPTYAFAPLRVDVDESQADAVKVWETYRGNDWDNKGEAVPGPGGRFAVRVLGVKNYYMERSSFSVLSILKNPMILLGLVSLVIFMGMPYLVNNMDPEMKAEWEERQKSNPMNSLMGAATGQPSGNPMGNFDMAAFLAGSQKKEGGGNAVTSGNGGNAGGGAGGGDGGGKKKGKR